MHPTGNIGRLDGPRNTPTTRTVGLGRFRLVALILSVSSVYSVGQDGPALDDYMGQQRLGEMSRNIDRIDLDEKPARLVMITQPFLIGVTEVTVAERRQFDPGFKTSAQSAKPAEDDAAGGVSWDRAVAFCAWLSEKEGKTHPPPTQAVWEYACRAGTITLFQHGDTFPDVHRKSLVTNRNHYVFNRAWIKDEAPASTK
jgi:formylglycine-generating enzyme required for sulfatase activity